MKSSEGLDTALVPLSSIDQRLLELLDQFPELLRDGIIDPRVVIEILESGTANRNDATFGLSWQGRQQAIAALRIPSQGALVPGFSAAAAANLAKHVFVEGEPLEVMKQLQKAYFGKFRMIYFNPPYNTPDDAFFEDELDGGLEAYFAHVEDVKAGREPTKRTRSQYHSRWLNMMLPRLYAARNLLTENGVIFASIDDHEAHHLRMLMDEVFGEENFVCNFIWEKRYSPPPDTKNVGYVTENILCYRRSDAFEASLLPMGHAQEARYKNRGDDPRGPWKAADYTCRYSAKERPNLYYPITDPETGDEIWPKKTRVWACSPKEHEKNVEEDLVWWGAEPKKKGEKRTPAKKRFLSEIRQGAMPMTLLKHTEVGHTDEATKQLRQWFPSLKLKKTPKPTGLLRHLMNIADVEGDDLILDCFGASGTTGEAVALSNAESKERIRFVIIQMPELVPDAEGIHMADVCRKRIEGALGQHEGGISHLRCFSLDQSAFRPPSDRELEALPAERQVELLTNNFPPGRTELALVFETLLRAGFPLTATIRKDVHDDFSLWVVEEDLLVIVCASTITGSLLAEIIKLRPEQAVFFESCFGHSDESKMNCALQLKEEGIEFRTI